MLLGAASTGEDYTGVRSWVFEADTPVFRGDFLAEVLWDCAWPWAAAQGVPRSIEALEEVICVVRAKDCGFEQGRVVLGLSLRAFLPKVRADFGAWINYLLRRQS